MSHLVSFFLFHQTLSSLSSPSSSQPTLQGSLLAASGSLVHIFTVSARWREKCGGGGGEHLLLCACVCVCVSEREKRRKIERANCIRKLSISVCLHQCVYVCAHVLKYSILNARVNKTAHHAFTRNKAVKPPATSVFAAVIILRIMVG